MAATRLIAMHINSGKTVAQCLDARISYAVNPDKTEDGTFVSSYGCDPKTADSEFQMSRQQYAQSTGRERNNDVIAYQIRQSFKPGEITPEQANEIGYETAMRWTKGKHAFIVATHTDKAHIHNHIIYNATALDGPRKFRNFRRSGLALQKLSDTICIENGLSVIEPAPVRERQKQQYDQDTFRNAIRLAIDVALQKKPADFAAFLQMLRDTGYEIKSGKYTAVKGPGQKRFIRLRSLGAGYTDADIQAVILGNAIHKSKLKSSQQHASSEFRLLIDLQEKLNQKGGAYQRWASVFNLKQMANVMLFLKENNISSLDELESKSETAAGKCDELQSGIHSIDDRMKEISDLRKHIYNYNKTRSVYVEYRKAGYSKKFRDAHQEELLLHKAAKQAFDELEMTTIPKVKDLNAEYEKLKSEKDRLYSALKQARSDSREYAMAKENVRMFLGTDDPIHTQVR